MYVPEKSDQHFWIDRHIPVFHADRHARRKNEVDQLGVDLPRVRRPDMLVIDRARRFGAGYYSKHELLRRLPRLGVDPHLVGRL
jgi:hypothetical protein